MWVVLDHDASRVVLDHDASLLHEDLLVFFHIKIGNQHMYLLAEDTRYPDTSTSVSLRRRHPLS